MATRPPLGSDASCILTIVGCCHGQLVHYKVCATVCTMKWTPHYRRPQTKMEVWLNIRCPLDMSRGHRICCRICTYNYMQYTGGAYQSREHFPSQHELGPRTLPLYVLTTCYWHGRNTCVWCSAHSSLHRSAAKQAGSGKKTCTMKRLRICDGREV